MFKFFKKPLGFDWILIFATLLLFIIGVIVIYSTTFKIASTGLKDFISQLIFGGIGFILLFIFGLIDYRVFKNFSAIFYVLMIILLGAVLVFGRTAGGATRWLNLGFTHIQPAEIAKLLFIMIMAKYFSEHNLQMKTFRYIIFSFLYALIPLILVALQPDLGTAIVFLVVWFSMLLFSQARRLHIFSLTSAGVLMLPFAWFFLKDYQKKRILTLFNPSIDPLGSGWNIKQAMIAIGSGRFFGRGLGRGSQSQLNFLPAQHTDFIFAVLSEEMGFLGTILVLVLFLIFLLRSLRITFLARDNFGMFLGIGITGMFFFHILINIGMNLGIMPVTGIPLPFVSYGGSSILISFIAVGILQSIVRRHKSIEF